jgi:hypothetical protein
MPSTKEGELRTWEWFEPDPPSDFRPPHPYRLRLFGAPYAIGWCHARAHDDRCLRLRDRHDARLLLSRFAGDPANLETLRTLLAERAGTHVSWLDDHQVLDRIADGLATARICIVEPELLPVDVMIPVSEAEPIPLVPFEPAPRPVPPPEPGDFEPHDQERQAAVLEAAADTGVPFCEECIPSG